MERAEALSLSPGLFMVQNIKPGQAFNFHTTAGVFFTIPNAEAQAMTYNLTCQRPRDGGIANWESGFEEFPNPAWCTLDKSVFTVPAHGQEQVGLSITIPDQPENYNRRWVLAVVLKTGSNAGIGVGMALAARVLIETAASPDPAKTGGAIGFAPSTLNLSGKPGAAVEGTLQLVNRTEGDLTLTADRLTKVIPDPVKLERITSNGFNALGDGSWLTHAVGPLQLPRDAGTVTPLNIRAIIPADAKPGQASEELIFLRGRTKNAGGVESEIVRFIRVRYQVDAPPLPTDQKP